MLVTEVVAAPSVELLAVEAAEVSADGRTMVITFNEAVAHANGTALTVADFTETSAADITNVAVNGKVVTLTFSTALANNDTVTAASTIVGGGIAGNTPISTADVITVTLAGGVYSIPAANIG